MNKVIKYLIIIIIGILLVLSVIGLLKKSSDTNKPIDNIAKTKIVSHKHYEYEIPENWNYSQEELYFELVDPSESGWKAQVALVYDADEYLFSRYGVVTKDLREKGYNFDEPEIKNFNGNDYLIYETTFATDDKIESRLLGYLHSERQYTYKIIIISNNIEYDYKALTKIGEILLKGKFDKTDTKYSYYTYNYDE